MTTESTNKPVEKIKVGNVQIPIWRNVNERGLYYSAGAPQLSYKKEGQWHNDGKAYVGRDLLHLAKAALLADSAILKLKLADAKGSGAAEDETAE
jgi:hypothetical protein